MAKPHPGHESLKKYLNNRFAWKEDWIVDENDKEKPEVYTHLEMKEAMRRLKTTDPVLHKLLAYLWLTDRSRNDIANGFGMDSSTLKRLWDKAMDKIVAHLRLGIRENDEVAPKLDPIDIIDPSNT
jgi:hypothetical protein